MKKLHPNSFVTFLGKYREYADSVRKNVEVTIQINRISGLEYLSESSYFLIINAARRANHLIRPSSDNTETKITGELTVVYDIDKKTYMRVKRIIGNVDWGKYDKENVPEIIREQVKKEIESVKEEVVRGKIQFNPWNSIK